MFEWVDDMSSSIDIELHSTPSSLSVALEEYRLLWRYYIVTIENRKSFFEFYFKTIVAPSLIVGSAGLFEEKISGEGYTFYVFLALAVIFAVGLSTYIAYCRESLNAKRYEVALARIRRFFGSVHPNLAEYISIDSLRHAGKEPPLIDIGSITFWRGNILTIFNAGIGAAPICYFLIWSSFSQIAGAFLILLIGQIAIYQVVFQRGSRNLLKGSVLVDEN